LTKQLSLFSNAAGDTSARKSSDYPYGPYLRRGMPENPLPAPSAEGAAATVRAVGDGVVRTDPGRAVPKKVLPRNFRRSHITNGRVPRVYPLAGAYGAAGAADSQDAGDVLVGRRHGGQVADVVVGVDDLIVHHVLAVHLVGVGERVGIGVGILPNA